MIIYKGVDIAEDRQISFRHNLSEQLTILQNINHTTDTMEKDTAMEETVSRTCPNIPRVIQQMGARHGTEQLADTAIELSRTSTEISSKTWFGYT